MADPDPNERLTLAEQFRLLATIIPEEQARARLDKAFRYRKIAYSPNYVVSYEDADIDWDTGRVTLRKPIRKTFTPTLTAAEFNAHFLPSTMALEQPPNERTAAEHSSETVYRTGLAGKPSSWHLVERECRRRYGNGERHPKRAEWARVLREWLASEHPQAPLPKEKTLTNKLASLLRELGAKNASDR